MRRRRRRRRRRGLRRAVAGAERGGSGEGTRLARLAASARISTPQPCASRALVSVSAAPSTAEAAELWATGRLHGDGGSFCNLLCCRKGGGDDDDGWVGAWVRGVASVIDPRCQLQSWRRPFLPASSRGRARGARAALGNPDRAGLRDGRRAASAALGLGGLVPRRPSRGVGFGGLGGALAGCREPAVSWPRVGLETP